MADFSNPQRMSPSAFVVIFVKILRMFLSVVILVVVVKCFNSESGSALIRALWSIAGVVLVALILALASYMTTKFHISQGNLIFSHGIFQREKKTIPLERIHSLRTKRGMVYRIFGLRGIAFDTLASKGEELELILDESDWRSLFSLIEKGEDRPEAAVAAQTDEKSRTIRFSNKALVVDALCQNHLKGFAILFGFMAVVYDRVNDFTDNAVDTITDYTASYFDGWHISLPWIVGAVVLLYIIVAALWVGKAIMRYYDMTLSIDKRILTFESGLLSRSSSRFSITKVCTISVKRNFLEKKLGYSTTMLRQALNVTAEKEEDNLKIYGIDRSGMFLQWWLGGDYAQSPVISTARSGKGVVVHVVSTAFVIAVAAILILCHFGLYFWSAVPVIYLLVYLLKGLSALRRRSITLRESHVVVNNGSFADVLNYIKYDNIQVVRIRRTPFTRWFHRVTLQLSTSGTTFSVRSLKEDEAGFISEALMQKGEEPRAEIG